MRHVKINTPVNKLALRVIYNNGIATVSIQTTSLQEFKLLKLVSESLFQTGRVRKPIKAAVNTEIQSHA